jgi:hypothetical protein
MKIIEVYPTIVSEDTRYNFTRREIIDFEHVIEKEVFLPKGSMFLEVSKGVISFLVPLSVEKMPAYIYSVHGNFFDGVHADKNDKWINMLNAKYLGRYKDIYFFISHTKISKLENNMITHDNKMIKEK